jgi:hypothetical protein
MIQSKPFFVRSGILMVYGAVLVTGAFGDEKRPAKRADRGKEDIEVPIKQVLAARTAMSSDNPKVQPGLVRWHTDFGAACEAAKKSRKPVLLFQMMGKLDDQFC